MDVVNTDLMKILHCIIIYTSFKQSKINIKNEIELTNNSSQICRNKHVVNQFPSRATVVFQQAENLEAIIKHYVGEMFSHLYSSCHHFNRHHTPSKGNSGRGVGE